MFLILLLKIGTDKKMIIRDGNKKETHIKLISMTHNTVKDAGVHQRFVLPLSFFKNSRPSYGTYRG